MYNLSTLSKILERVIARQLNTYIHANHILNPYQSAYTKHKSTETVMIYILNHINLSATSPHGSVIIFLAISAAFDTLDHDILINRLPSKQFIDAFGRFDSESIYSSLFRRFWAQQRPKYNRTIRRFWAQIVIKATN